MKEKKEETSQKYISNFEFRHIGVTDVGLVREHNEDYLEIVDSDKLIASSEENLILSTSKGNLLMVLADGMGGMNAGEVASKIAVQSFVNAFKKEISADFYSNKDSEIFTKLKNYIKISHESIIKEVSIHPEHTGMGTTLVAALILEDKAFIVWCGDSRAYLYRRNEGLKRVTKDHSYVQSLVDSGQINDDEAFFHPQSNIILQSLGDNSSLPKPDVVKIWLQKDDIIMLCTDGLNGMIDDNQIALKLNRDPDNLREMANDLISEAKNAGGKDNITIILTSLSNGPAEAKYPISEKLNNNNNKDLKFWILAGLGIIGLIAIVFVLLFNKTTVNKTNTANTKKKFVNENKLDNQSDRILPSKTTEDEKKSDDTNRKEKNKSKPNNKLEYNDIIKGIDFYNIDSLKQQKNDKAPIKAPLKKLESKDTSHNNKTEQSNLGQLNTESDSAK